MNNGIIAIIAIALFVFVMIMNAKQHKKQNFNSDIEKNKQHSQTTDKQKEIALSATVSAADENTSYPTAKSEINDRQATEVKKKTASSSAVSVSDEKTDCSFTELRFDYTNFVCDLLLRNTVNSVKVTLQYHYQDYGTGGKLGWFHGEDCKIFERNSFDNPDKLYEAVFNYIDRFGSYGFQGIKTEDLQKKLTVDMLCPNQNQRQQASKPVVRPAANNKPKESPISTDDRFELLTDIISYFLLVDIIQAERIADRAGSYDEFLLGIKENLSRHPEIKHMRGVTNDSQWCYEISAEDIAWIFLLMYPSHPLIDRLDRTVQNVIKAAQTLKLEDYVWRESSIIYDSEKVANKLGCSKNTAGIIAKYWGALSIGYNPDNNTIDLKCVFKRKNTAETAAELWNAYCACGMDEAREKVQEYLGSVNPKLKVLFPSYEIDIRHGKTVAKIWFTHKEQQQQWKDLPHPFFKANSRNPKRSAELFLQYLHQQGHFQHAETAYLFDDGHNEYKGYNSNGSESSLKIEFEYREQHSYHDGGGGWYGSLALRALSEDEKNKLAFEKLRKPKRDSIPVCREFWEKNGSIYVADPFEMEGVFSLVSYSRDFESKY